MRTIELKVYTINEHLDKDKCFDWIRNNWYDLNEHSAQEVVDSLKALHSAIGGDLDYSISSSPCRGEYITFEDYDEDLLNELDANELPLTGVCWDADLIESMQKDGDAYGVLRALHQDTEYLYSDEGLQELCETNQYEFTEEGEVY
tara:strand:+ start:3067 stop:3504 length:438 start_codon:yes stop_codon:yes gene_type:complete